MNKQQKQILEEAAGENLEQKFHSAPTILKQDYFIDIEDAPF